MANHPFPGSFLSLHSDILKTLLYSQEDKLYSEMLKLPRTRPRPKSGMWTLHECLHKQHRDCQCLVCPTFLEGLLGGKKKSRATDLTDLRKATSMSLSHTSMSSAFGSPCPNSSKYMQSHEFNNCVAPTNLQNTKLLLYVSDIISKNNTCYLRFLGFLQT